MHKAIIMVMLAAVTSWGAVEFDNTNYLRCEEDTNIPTGGSDITWAAWVYPTGWDVSFWSTIVAKAGAANYKGWFFGITGDTATPQGRVHLRNQANMLNESSTGTIPLNEWSHVAAVFHDTAIEIDWYINGEYDSTDSGGFDIQSTTQAVTIAVDSRDYSGYEWEGMLDDIRVYDAALTSNQIASIFLNTCDKFVPEYGTNTTLIANQDPGFDPRESNTNTVAMWDSDYLAVADGNAIYTAIFLGVNQTYWGSSYDQRKLIEFDSNFAVTGNEFDLNAEYHSKIAMWFNSAPREVCFYGDYVFIAEKGYAECIVVLNASDFSFYCYRNIREFADITGSVLEGIAVDENYIYITSTTRKIYRFTISGTTINYIDYFDVSAQVPALATLSIGIGNDGNLYTMNNGDDNVYYYDVSGNFLGTYDPTFFSANANPYSIQQMSNGNWVISDIFASGNNKISVFNSTFGSPTYYDAPATSSANVLSGFDNLNPITGTWHDATGNGNDATIYNNPTREAPR